MDLVSRSRPEVGISLNPTAGTPRSKKGSRQSVDRCNGGGVEIGRLGRRFQCYSVAFG